MTGGTVAGQILESFPLAGALAQFRDDTKREWVAADTGQMLTQQVRGSAEVTGGGRADHFEVMAFPVHLPTTHGSRWCVGEGAEIGDGELEGGIGVDGVAERPDGVNRGRGLLSVAIEGCGRHIGRHRPAVVLDRGTGKGRFAMAA